MSELSESQKKWISKASDANLVKLLCCYCTTCMGINIKKFALDILLQDAYNRGKLGQERPKV